jgi:hypothetical protein
MHMTTSQGELFPASCLHVGDIFRGVDEAGLHQAASMRRKPGNRWYVLIKCDDGIERPYFMSEPVWVFTV